MRSVRPAPCTGMPLAIVMLTCGNLCLSYAEILSKAKEEISLDELGIPEKRMRRAFTGGLIIEIPGEEATKRVNFLAEHLKKVFKEQDIRIQKPTK